MYLMGYIIQRELNSLVLSVLSCSEYLIKGEKILVSFYLNEVTWYLNAGRIYELIQNFLFTAMYVIFSNEFQKITRKFYILCFLLYKAGMCVPTSASADRVPFHAIKV